MKPISLFSIIVYTPIIGYWQADRSTAVVSRPVTLQAVCFDLVQPVEDMPHLGQVIITLFF
jgi:hypothetical protein